MTGERKEDYLPPHIQELQRQFPSDVWWRLTALPPTPLQISAYLDHEDGTTGVALILRLSTEQAESMLTPDDSSTEELSKDPEP